VSATSAFASTPAPPYYAVIFTSKRTASDEPGYAGAAERMVDLGSRYAGFLGLETARAPDGLGITVSYWRDEAALLAWKRDTEHQKAQRGGRDAWYERYEVRVAKVERAYGFARDASA
jgi:heme-degrading monooxygenase HmoA